MPKGVAIQHRSAVAMVRWCHEMFGAEEYAGLLVSTSICFDMSVFEIFATLSAGGKLLLAENALALPDLEAKDEVVLVDTVPSAMAELLRLGRLPASIRTVNLGGEPVKASLVRDLYDHLPNLERVVNLYGPSEDTTFTSYAVLPRGDQHPLIGRPLTGESAYVLDGEMRPVPLGVPGALYLGGEGITRGYLGRPELTAERYIPNPYGPPGSRLYQVGDLVRYLPTGELDFLGRLDHQVKVRGFRIELGEIESALTRHPQVLDAAVLAMPDLLGGNRLIAYLATEEELPASELRAFLKAGLPDYMVPSVFVPLPELPLTPNGKIDRRSLAALPLQGESAAEDRSPSGYAEEALAGIWSEIFGHPVGVSEDFFDLGGHSLLATRLVSRVREALGVELPVRRLFERPTIAGLAESVEAALGVGGALEARIEPVPRTAPLPLSFAQERFWFLQRLEPGSAAYNVPAAVELAGPLNAGALAAAWTGLARRQESLRVTFEEAGGAPRQRIAPAPAGAPLPLVDLAALPAAAGRAEVERLERQQAATPFDLERGPLAVGLLARLGEENHRFLVNLHHIIADGWSIGVLIRDLGALYAAAAGFSSVLPELPVQYADFAAWQRRRLSGEALAAELAFWRRQLDGVPPLELPTDRPRPALFSGRGAACPVELPAGLAAGLGRLCREERVTLFMALYAGFSLLLQRYTGQADFAVGTPVAGRTRAETEELIGCFINTLALRADLGGEPALAGVLERARETTLDAFARQELPFERLVGELQPERDPSRTPIFQTMLALQNAPRATLELPGLTLSLLPGEARTAKFDLTLALQEEDGGLRGEIEYSTDLFDPATVQRLARHYETLLAALASGSLQRSPGELSPLTAAERAQLLVEWNDSAFPVEEATLHELFARQAALHPEREAVVCGGEVLTYAALSRSAGRLARRLRALGVAAEEPVALYFERSPAVLVAMLGVLEAGGAYMPLDVSYPPERLAALWENAGRPLLLTERRLAPAFADPGSVLCLDEMMEEGEAAGAAPARSLGPGGLAYVLHTSGSTGNPKGVCCTHRGVLNLLADFARRRPLAAGSRGSLWTSLSFDVSVYEIFSPLLAGGAVHIVPEEIRQDAERFLEWLERERIESAYVPPFMVVALRQRLEQAPEAIPLSRLLVGVEPIPEPELTRIAELRPGLAVINGYGPTEATICATLYDVDRRRTRFGNPPVTPIGRPVINSAVYLLDRWLAPVPVGVPGELCVGGAGLARGYLGRAAATAERFVPDPWSAAGGERLYRTGDLVRRRADGNLEFVGRIDHQIKLRGFRIEPGEIEAALRAHPEVGEAVVAVVGGEGGLREHRRLVAYLVPAGDRVLSDAELREHLRDRLPAYMVPAAFVILPELPLTASGKLDRKALLAHQPPASAAADAVAARTPAEELVAGIFAEVLQVERVDAEASFFALGGHSLLATQVVSRVRQVFGVELPLRALFEAPTVAGLAAEIAALSAAGRRTEAPPLVRAERVGAALLRPAAALVPRPALARLGGLQHALSAPPRGGRSTRASCAMS